MEGFSCYHGAVKLVTPSRPAPAPNAADDDRTHHGATRWRAGGGGVLSFSLALSLSSVSQNLKFFGWSLVIDALLEGNPSLQPVEIDNALIVMMQISKLVFVV